jgi:hypothetical protein
MRRDLHWLSGNDELKQSIAEWLNNPITKVVLEIAKNEAGSALNINPLTHTSDYGNAAFGMREGHDRLLEFIETLDERASSGKPFMANPDMDFGTEPEEE